MKFNGVIVLFQTGLISCVSWKEGIFSLNHWVNLCYVINSTGKGAKVKNTNMWWAKLWHGTLQTLFIGNLTNLAYSSHWKNIWSRLWFNKGDFLLSAVLWKQAKGLELSVMIMFLLALTELLCSYRGASWSNVPQFGFKSVVWKMDLW